eukprot:768809-Hanusia_phi.AAC.5
MSELQEDDTVFLQELVIVPDDERDVVSGVYRYTPFCWYSIRGLIGFGGFQCNQEQVQSVRKTRHIHMEVENYMFVTVGDLSLRGFIPIMYKTTMHLFAAGEESTFQVEQCCARQKGCWQSDTCWPLGAGAEESSLLLEMAPPEDAETFALGLISQSHIFMEQEGRTETKRGEEGCLSIVMPACRSLFSACSISIGGIAMAICGYGQATCRGCKLGGIEKEFPASRAVFANQGAKLLLRSSTEKFAGFGIFMDDGARYDRMSCPAVCQANIADVLLEGVKSVRTTEESHD